MSTEALWVVLYCAADDSHVLVLDNAVIYDDCLNLEDEVKFDYPGAKKMLTGVVKGFSVDKKVMVKLMDKLNAQTKPKREGSFHAGAPRKAAMRAKETLLKNTKNVATPPTHSILGKALADAAISSDSESESTKNKPVTSNGNNKSRQVDDSDDISDSVSSNDDLTEEERALLAKLTAKKERKDMNRLQMLIKNKETPASSSTEANDSTSKSVEGSLSSANSKKSVNPEKNTEDNHKNEDKTPQSPTLSQDDGSEEKANLGTGSGDSDARKEDEDAKKKRKIDSSEDSDAKEEDEDAKKKRKIDSSEDSDAKEEDEDAKKKRKIDSSEDDLEIKAPKTSRRKKKKSKADDIIKITFEGEHYNHKASDPKVTKLVDDIEVYVTEKEFKKLKAPGVFSTVTSMARYLTRIIYTKDARNVCSVSGKPSLAKGMTKPEQRTMLDSKGIEAILEFVIKRGERKGWKVPPASTVKQSIGNMLCEERPRPAS